MTRSLRKGPYVADHLIKKVTRATQAASREPIKTWARSSVIIPDFVGHTFLVHNGRTFIRVYATENMVGHRLGEFSLTRTFRGHSGRKAAAPEG